MLLPGELPRSRITGHTSGVKQICDDLEGVPLVDQELLPLGGIVHLLRVLGHQRVEEGIELISPLAPWLAL